jgi:dipeptidyl aminopeptidase/acylaminoacyl peptidase
MRRSIALVVVLVPLLCWSAPAGAAVVNGKIIFIVDRSFIFQIATIDPDGTHRATLTSGRATNFDPQWSPDGTMIAFDRAGGHESLRTMNADGTNVQTVFPLSSLPGSLFISGLSWSPDGSQLAFSAFRSRTNSFKLFVVDVAGTALTRLSSSADNDTNPSWSPDGTQIAVESYPGRTGLHGDIVLIQVSDESRTPLVTAGSTGQPDWSPDGSAIAFTKTIDGIPDLFRVDAGGGTPTRLTATPSRFEFNPAWSPDGTLIVFAKLSPRSGPEDLWTISSTDGSGPTQITDTPNRGEIQPDWQVG